MINTKEDFKALVESIEKESWYKQPLGFGIARVSRGVLNPKLILEATFPVVNWNENHKSAAVFLAALKQSGNNVDCTKSEAVFDMGDGVLGYGIEAFKPFYEKNSKKIDEPNLEGIEDLLTNCAWIDAIPVEIDWLRQNEILLKVGAKYPKVDYVGKYSRFLIHIIPSNDETSCKATLLK